MLAALLLLGVTSLPADLTAVGTIVGPRSERCVAILRSNGRSRVVAIGDTAFGARVAAIRAGVVTLEVDGERRELRLSAAEAAAPLVALFLPSAAGPPEDPTTPARAMQRQEVERRLNQEIPRILAETTLVPLMEEGRAAGFTLTRLPPNSLLTDAGLLPGDILTRVNEVEIDSMATLVGLYARLQNESTLRAVVLRNGHPVSLSITLR